MFTDFWGERQINNSSFTLGTDIDNSTLWQDDEPQHNQQSNQVAVQDSFPITIKMILVIKEQDDGANPPAEKEKNVSGERMFLHSKLGFTCQVFPRWIVVFIKVWNIPKHTDEKFKTAGENEIVTGYPPAPTEHHHSRHFAGKRGGFLSLMVTEVRLKQYAGLS